MKPTLPLPTAPHSSGRCVDWHKLGWNKPFDITGAFSSENAARASASRVGRVLHRRYIIRRIDGRLYAWGVA